MLQSLITGTFKALGGAVGDVVELVKDTGNAVASIPDAISDGYEQGLMVTPEGMDQAAQAVIDEPSELSPDEQELARLRLRVEELEATETTPASKPGTGAFAPKS